jgi:hypothetical protein
MSRLRNHAECAAGVHKKAPEGAHPLSRKRDAGEEFDGEALRQPSMPLRNGKLFKANIETLN